MLPPVHITSLTELSLNNYNHINEVLPFLRMNGQLKRLNLIHRHKVYGSYSVTISDILPWCCCLDILYLRGKYSKVRADFHRALLCRHKFKHLIVEIGENDDDGYIV